jgi:hypothetical protein
LACENLPQGVHPSPVSRPTTPNSPSYSRNVTRSTTSQNGRTKEAIDFEKYNGTREAVQHIFTFVWYFPREQGGRLVNSFFWYQGEAKGGRSTARRKAPLGISPCNPHRLQYSISLPAGQPNPTNSHFYFVVNISSRLSDMLAKYSRPLGKAAQQQQ